MKAKWDVKSGETRKSMYSENQDGIMTVEESPEVTCCWQAKENGSQNIFSPPPTHQNES